jgi:hypothetical protein
MLNKIKNESELASITSKVGDMVFCSDSNEIFIYDGNSYTKFKLNPELYTDCMDPQPPSSLFESSYLKLKYNTYDRNI